jgi:PleD family two-component response regulator
MAIAHDASDIAKVVTISLGVAARDVGAIGDASALVALADTQLYQAKHAGRGCVRGDQLTSAHPSP